MDKIKELEAKIKALEEQAQRAKEQGLNPSQYESQANAYRQMLATIKRVRGL